MENDNALPPSMAKRRVARIATGFAILVKVLIADDFMRLWLDVAIKWQETLRQASHPKLDHYRIAGSGLSRPLPDCCAGAAQAGA
jgi:hypothetical protein